MAKVTRMVTLKECDYKGCVKIDMIDDFWELGDEQYCEDHYWEVLKETCNHKDEKGNNKLHFSEYQERFHCTICFTKFGDKNDIDKAKQILKEHFNKVKIVEKETKTELKKIYDELLKVEEAKNEK